jgi:hypothetical protein
MILKRIRSLVELVGTIGMLQDTNESFKKPFQLALGAMAILRTIPNI